MRSKYINMASQLKEIWQEASKYSFCNITSATGYCKSRICNPNAYSLHRAVSAIPTNLSLQTDYSKWLNWLVVNIGSNQCKDAFTWDSAMQQHYRITPTQYRSRCRDKFQLPFSTVMESHQKIKSSAFVQSSNHFVVESVGEFMQWLNCAE